MVPEVHICTYRIGEQRNLGGNFGRVQPAFCTVPTTYVPGGKFAKEYCPCASVVVESSSPAIVSDQAFSVPLSAGVLSVISSVQYPKALCPLKALKASSGRNDWVNGAVPVAIACKAESSNTVPVKS